MNEILKYCLSETGCEKKGISKVKCQNGPVITVLTVIHTKGEIYAAADERIFDRAARNINNRSELLDICRGLSDELGAEMAPSDEILCYEVPKCGFGGGALRLTGEEKDALFSDLPYLVTLGPVYGIVRNGAVVSLAGAVDRGSVYEVHIETAPAYRKRGFGTACLKSLSAEVSKPLMYRCRSKNTASDRTVRSVGGKLILKYETITLRSLCGLR